MPNRKIAEGSKIFSIFCWNIANPSEERAGKQATWLKKRPEDILILTEVKQSQGCLFIEKYLKVFGYNFIFPKPIDNEYGVMVVSKKHELTTTPFFNKITYLQSRIASVKINGLEIVAVYIPSRGFDEGERALKKKNFIDNLLIAFQRDNSANKRIFCGDFNIVEPNHIPFYKYFHDWEYNFYRDLSEKYQMRDIFRLLHPDTQEHSWFGHSGNGYRYDHCFVSNNIISSVKECYYLHEPRENNLSDHSALIVELEL